MSPGKLQHNNLASNYRSLVIIGLVVLDGTDESSIKDDTKVRGLKITLNP